MEPVPPVPALDMEALRQRRAELRESINALEQALAAPAPGRVEAWGQRVHVALVELSGDFRQHIEVTEGPHGLYGGVLTSAPRLSNAVTRLTREHADINGLLEDLLARVSGSANTDRVEDIRGQGTLLLDRLIRHRQRGADLVYEAFQADVGGET
jgi:hypothetical protein